MANQLIRVFLKFNFMALQHQDKQSRTLLWVSELYPLCLQLLNSLVRVIECCTFKSFSRAQFCSGMQFPTPVWSVFQLSPVWSQDLQPLSQDAEYLSRVWLHQAKEQICAPESLSCRVCRREQFSDDVPEGPGQALSPWEPHEVPTCRWWKGILPLCCGPTAVLHPAPGSPALERRDTGGASPEEATKLRSEEWRTSPMRKGWVNLGCSAWTRKGFSETSLQPSSA